MLPLWKAATHRRTPKFSRANGHHVSLRAAKRRSNPLFREQETASAAAPPRSDTPALLWKATASRRRATSQAVGAVSTAAGETTRRPPRVIASREAAKQSPFSRAGDCFGGCAASQRHTCVALESNGKSPQGDFAGGRCSFNCRRGNTEGTESGRVRARRASPRFWSAVPWHRFRKQRCSAILQKERFQERLLSLNHDARGIIFVSQRNEWSKIPPTHTPTEHPL